MSDSLENITESWHGLLIKFAKDIISRSTKSRLNGEIMHRFMAMISSAVLCCSCISYPSDYHLYEDLRSFRAQPLEQIPGESYRLVWHAWHQRPGLILANCSKYCYLELRYTDGYGTYSQGKLDGVVKTAITKSEFKTVVNGFEEGQFANLNPYLRPDERYDGLIESASEDEIVICLHAPYYYLERYVKKEYLVIYRYCQNNYSEDLAVAFPLIELAEKYFPSEMKLIKAVWLNNDQEDGSKAN